MGHFLDISCPQDPANQARRRTCHEILRTHRDDQGQQAYCECQCIYATLDPRPAVAATFLLNLLPLSEPSPSKGKAGQVSILIPLLICLEQTFIEIGHLQWFYRLTIVPTLLLVEHHGPQQLLQ